MKKIITLILCAAVLVLALGGCAKKEPNVVFTGTIEEVSEKSILVTTADEVSFDKASVSYDDSLKLSFTPAVGQVVKITILPQIAESYPVQVRAVAIELVSEPASPDAAHADFNASFLRADSQKEGGWDFIVGLSANADTMEISSVRHIPVIVIDSTAKLADFLSAGKAFFQFDSAYNDEASLTEYTAIYDDAFFKDNKLLILYAQETSGSIRHEIKDAAISGGMLSVEVGTITPEMGTTDMADWFILLELQNTELEGVSSYDAHYPLS